MSPQRFEIRDEIHKVYISAIFITMRVHIMQKNSEEVS
jgi:hypothetical protein